MQTFKVVFYLRKSRTKSDGTVPVYSRIYLNTDRCEMGSSGHAVKESDWDERKCRVKGKSVAAMQTTIAESLGMERGTPKDETGIEHLAVLEYKEKKAKETLQRVKEKQEEAETELAEKEEKAAIAEKKARKAEFDERQAKRAATQAAYNRSAAERETELAKEETARQRDIGENIKAENTRLKSDNAAKVEENRRLDKEIASKRKKAALNDKDMAIAELNDRIKWRQTAINIMADILYRGIELFRKAVDTIIKFAKSIYNLFDGSEAAVIKDCIDSMAKTDEDRTAIGNMLITFSEVKGKLSEDEYYKMSREVDDVVAGGYDARIERGSNISY